MKGPLSNVWIRRCLLAVFTVLLGLTGVEMILRLWFPFYLSSPLEAYQYDPELGVRLRPGIHLFKTTDYQEEVQVNHLGTVNFQENFSDYSSLVFALGDSYTQGTGLPADVSYPFQLDFILNQNDAGFYRKQFGVVNLGIAAYGGEQALLALRRWSISIGRPRVILYVGCDNDYSDDQLFKNGSRHKHIVTGSPVWGRFVPLMQWCTDDLQIGIRLKIALARWRRSQVENRAASDFSEGGRGPVIAELQKGIIQRLAAAAKEYDALLIVSWSDSGSSYSWLKSWAAGQSIPFADWYSRVEKVQAAIPSLPLNNAHSGRHHRAWVNRLIAEEFARQIRANQN